MAIVTGLPAGAVLWKFSAMKQVYARNPETRQYEYMNRLCYYTVELYTRRARSNGAIIDKSLVPFMEKLKIRLEKSDVWMDGSYQEAYRAIGVQIVETFDEQRWAAKEVHETATKYYRKLKNGSMSLILDKRSIFNEANLIDEMKEAAVDFELDSEWPDEPSIPVYDPTAGVGW